MQWQWGLLWLLLWLGLVLIGILEAERREEK
jgi:hypothetical protein